jgi:hypothetical protein
MPWLIEIQNQQHKPKGDILRAGDSGRQKEGPFKLTLLAS